MKTHRFHSGQVVWCKGCEVFIQLLNRHAAGFSSSHWADTACEIDRAKKDGEESTEYLRKKGKFRKRLPSDYTMIHSTHRTELLRPLTKREIGLRTA